MAEDDRKPKIHGAWTHNSYLIDPDNLTAKKWADNGKLTAHSNDDGSFEGKLVFNPPPPGPSEITLLVEGNVSAGKGTDPSSFKAIGKGQEGLADVVYQLSGWLNNAEDEVRGSIVNSGKDLAKKPVGTVGYFILKKD
ncbi:MAG: hypothetical protein NTX45_02495 [Proteobacteria bacterium]|nr:hypothetical protein [Pseudomonadota bacterium]